MEAGLLQEMHNKLSELVESGVLENKKIVIFGSNEPAERMMNYLSIRNVKTSALVDNNKLKAGSLLTGVKVYLPEDFLTPFNDNFIILIASKYYDQMLVQLKGLGYEENRHVIKVLQINNHSTTDLSADTFNERVNIVEAGTFIYEKIKDKFTDSERIFIYPLVYMGDIFILLSFIREYCRKENIKKYCIVYKARIAEKIAALFGMQDMLYRVSDDEMDKLVQFSIFTELDNGRIKILSQSYSYITRYGKIGNYKGINFADDLLGGVFGIKADECYREYPAQIRSDGEINKELDKLFKDNGLKPGKTVIIFPYAKSASLIDMDFWEKLVKKLINEGYTVCTNCGSKEEKAIGASVPMFVDLKLLIGFVDMCGCMVALRSGTCDVLSVSTARKIILYPDRIYNCGSFFDYFSLNGMNLDKAAVERVVKDDEDTNNLVDEVMDYLFFDGRRPA